MKAKKPEPKLLTTAQLAAAVGVSVPTIRRWMKRGVIVPTKQMPDGKAYAGRCSFAPEMVATVKNILKGGGQ